MARPGITQYSEASPLEGVGADRPGLARLPHRQNLQTLQDGP